MTVSQLIKTLQTFESAYGDLEVFGQDVNTTLGCIRPGVAVQAKEVAVLNKRERNARFRIGNETPSGRFIAYIR